MSAELKARKTVAYKDHSEMVESARIDLRLDPELKELFEVAASASSVKVSTFIKTACRKVAEEVIEKERRIRLEQSEYARMMDMLASPPQFNDRLRTAMANAKSGVVKIGNKSDRRLPDPV
jgi:uncharacterized protein (DUF1778 family)